MKRKWAYLGALLPLSTAASAWAVGAAGHEYDPQAAARKKNVIDEEDGKPANKQGDKQAQEIEAHNVNSPSGGGSGEDAPDDDGLYDLNQALTAGDPKVKVSLPYTDNSMYAPGGGGDASGQKQYGGGGLLSVSSKGQKSAETTNSTDGTGSNTNEVSDPQNPDAVNNTGGDPLADSGYVEPDPADADAMLILLGGTATGSGDGATTSGEVNLQIVDYGMITVGFGYAKYSASGSDGSTADTFAAVEGADVFYIFGFDYGFMNYSYSVTYVLALDFEEAEYAQMLGWNDCLMQGPLTQWLVDSEKDVSVNGNTAFLTFHVDVQDNNLPEVDGSTIAIAGTGSSVTASGQSEQASLWLNGNVSGIDTLASASGSLIEIEDQFSSVSGVVIGVG